MLTMDYYTHSISWMGIALYNTISTQIEIIDRGFGIQEVYAHMIRGKIVQVFEGIDAMQEFGLTSIKKNLTGFGYAENETFYVSEADAAIYGMMMREEFSTTATNLTQKPCLHFV